MCLIDATDSFIKARYKVFLKLKNRKVKSKFFERIQNDIKERKVLEPA